MGYLFAGLIGVVAGILLTFYYLNRQPEKLKAWAAKIEAKIRAKL